MGRFRASLILPASSVSISRLPSQRQDRRRWDGGGSATAIQLATVLRNNPDRVLSEDKTKSTSAQYLQLSFGGFAYLLALLSGFPNAHEQFYFNALLD